MRYTLPFNVRWKDIDAMGHVNNAVYLTYMEFIRVRWFMDVVGIQSTTELPLIIARAEVDFRDAMDLSCVPEIDLWTSRIGSRSWDFSYEIRESDTDKVYANGRTVQVSYDYEMRSSVPIPDQILDHLKATSE